MKKTPTKSLQVLIFDEPEMALHIQSLLKNVPLPPGIVLAPVPAYKPSEAYCILPDADIVIADISTPAYERFAHNVIIGQKPALLVSVLHGHDSMTEYPTIKFCSKAPWDLKAFQQRVQDLVKYVLANEAAAESLADFVV